MEGDQDESFADEELILGLLEERYTLAPPPQHAPRANETILLDKYKYIEIINRGGMADIARFRDEKTNRDVAGKILRLNELGDPGLIKRMEREVRALSKVHHPYLISMFDIATWDGRPVIFQELLVGGKTIDEAIRAGRRFEPKEAIEIATALAEALAAVHRQGVVHGDVTPRNVWLYEQSHHVKLFDFGLSETEDHTPVGLASGGTRGYMAPEQAFGSATRASDVWAVGTLLLQMLSGVAMPPRLDTQDSLRRQLAELNVAQPVRNVLARCLAQNSVDRYADGEEMLRGLRAASASAGAVGRAPYVSLFALCIGIASAYWVAADCVSGVPGASALRRWSDNTVGLTLCRRCASPRQTRTLIASLQDAVQEKLLSNHANARWTNHPGVPEAPIAPYLFGQALYPILRRHPDDRAVVSLLDSLLSFVERRDQEVEYSGRRYAWFTPDRNIKPLAEGLFWSIATFARCADRFRGSPTYADRGARCERAMLHLQQEATLHKGPSAGSWTMFPYQNPRFAPSCYSAAMALLALNTTRESGVHWLESVEERDRLTLETALWLESAFDQNEQGWHAFPRDFEGMQRGLTFQVLTELYRTDGHAGYHLGSHLRAVASAALLQASEAPRQSLIDGSGRYLVYGLPPVETDSPFDYRWEHQINFMWHPWALSLSARNLRYLVKTHASKHDILTARVIAERLITENQGTIMTIARARLPVGERIDYDDSWMSAEELSALEDASDIYVESH